MNEITLMNGDTLEYDNIILKKGWVKCIRETHDVCVPDESIYYPKHVIKSIVESEMQEKSVDFIK